MEHIFRPRHAADYLQFTCRCLRPVSVSVAVAVLFLFLSTALSFPGLTSASVGVCQTKSLPKMSNVRRFIIRSPR